MFLQVLRVVFVLALLTNPVLAWACSCRGYDLDTGVCNAQLAFVGRPDNYLQDKNTWLQSLLGRIERPHYSIVVEEVLLGEAPRKIRIISGGDSAACDAVYGLNKTQIIVPRVKIDDVFYNDDYCHQINFFRDEVILRKSFEYVRGSIFTDTQTCIAALKQYRIDNQLVDADDSDEMIEESGLYEKQLEEGPPVYKLAPPSP